MHQALRHNTVRSGAIYYGRARGRKKKIRPASTSEFSPLQCGLGVMGGALERIGIRDIMGGDHSFNELHLLR